MDLENLYGRMVKSMKESGAMVRETAVVEFTTKMERSTTVSGEMMPKMDMEKKHTQRRRI